MGKTGGKRNAKVYHHAHNPNANARESDERRAQAMRQVEIKRLTNRVQRQEVLMRAYIRPEDKVVNKIDPSFQLKGAARCAREYYPQPDLKPEVPPRDLIEELADGNMWDHSEGQNLLQYKLELGIALHNLVNKSRDAVKMLSEVLTMDKEDHLLARHALLRCYLDEGHADKARALLEKYPSDTYSCFSYSRALIEHIAITLGEEDASQSKLDDALIDAVEANPYTIWIIAFSDVFDQCIEHVDQISPQETKPGSIEDALIFYGSDLQLWKETEGLVEYIQDFIEQNKLSPPDVQQQTKKVKVSGGSKVDHSKASSSSSSSSNNNNNNNDKDEQPVDYHKMYLGMFSTAVSLLNE